MSTDRDPRAVRFGARLRQLRLVSTMNQRELAERCGITQSAVSQLESGAVCPTFPLLHSLASALGVSPASFWPE